MVSKRIFPVMLMTFDLSLMKFKMMYFEIKWGNYLLVCYHAIPFQNDHERHTHTGVKPFLIKPLE